MDGAAALVLAGIVWCGWCWLRWAGAAAGDGAVGQRSWRSPSAQPQLPRPRHSISPQQQFLFQLQRWARFITHSLFFWWCWQADATSTNLCIYFPENKVKFSSLKNMSCNYCCSLQPRLSALVRESQAKSWQFSGPDWLLVINIKHLFTPSFQPQYAIKEIIKFPFFGFAVFAF